MDVSGDGSSPNGFENGTYYRREIIRTVNDLYLIFTDDIQECPQKGEHTAAQQEFEVHQSSFPIEFHRVYAIVEPDDMTAIVHLLVRSLRGFP